MKTENQNQERTGSRTTPETRDPQNPNTQTKTTKEKEFDTLKPDLTQTPNQNNGVNDPRTAPKTRNAYETSEVDVLEEEVDEVQPITNDQERKDQRTTQTPPQTNKEQQPVQQQPNQRNQPQTDPRKQQDQSATKREEPKR